MILIIQYFKISGMFLGCGQGTNDPDHNATYPKASGPSFCNKSESINDPNNHNQLKTARKGIFYEGMKAVYVNGYSIAYYNG